MMMKLLTPALLVCALAAVSPARAADPPSNEIPAGTVVSVRTIDPVDSEYDQEGKVYRASLSADLFLDGQAIARKGDAAQIRLHTLTQSGKVSGNAEVTLELYSITVNGKPVPVQSGDVTQDSAGKGKKTVRNAGLGVLAGGLIGALAGGGKGAAIGAASGGALGTGASVLTKGPKVRIPSETLLRFTLSQSAKYE
jgi:hypothetical protein